MLTGVLTRPRGGTALTRGQLQGHHVATAALEKRDAVRIATDADRAGRETALNVHNSLALREFICGSVRSCVAKLCSDAMSQLDGLLEKLTSSV